MSSERGSCFTRTKNDEIHGQKTILFSDLSDREISSVWLLFASWTRSFHRVLSTWLSFCIAWFHHALDSCYDVRWERRVSCLSHSKWNESWLFYSTEIKDTGVIRGIVFSFNHSLFQPFPVKNQLLYAIVWEVNLTKCSDIQYKFYITTALQSIKSVMKMWQCLIETVDPDIFNISRKEIKLGIRPTQLLRRNCGRMRMVTLLSVVGEPPFSVTVSVCKQARARRTQYTDMRRRLDKLCKHHGSWESDMLVAKQPLMLLVWVVAIFLRIQS